MQEISNLLGRLIAFISMVLMGFGFFMLIKTIKKNNRMRASSLLLSMIFSVIMLLFNVFVMRNAKIQWWFALVLIFGAGFGIAWGTTTALKIHEEKILGKRSVLYVYFWLASMTITQVLAFIAKSDAVAIGLAGMFFSTGASLGTNSNILYRLNRYRLITQAASSSKPGFTGDADAGPTAEVIQKGIIPDSKRSLTTQQKSQFSKRKKINLIFIGFSIGIAILVFGGYMLVRFILINQGSSISLNIDDNQLSFSAASEEQNQDGQILQDNLGDGQSESTNADPETAPDPSLESTSTEETEISQGGENSLDTVILSEDFNGRTGNAIPFFSDEYMRFFYGEGFGVIESTTNPGLLPIIYPEIKTKDFIAEFEFMMPDAFNDSRCGIIFRLESDISDGLDSYYALFLYPKANSLNMGIWIDGQWIHSPSLNPDPSFNLGYELNHVRLEVKEGSMKIYINGSFVSGFDEDTLLEPGLIGLFLFPSASVIDGNPEYVAFDNLQVWNN